MAQESTQPSDQQDGAGQAQGQGSQQPGGSQSQQSAPGQAEVQRRKQQAVQQAAEDESRGSAAFFTKDHLIEEGAVEARNLYGKSKVGDEDEWYDLIDVFLMLPEVLEQEFAKKFRKRAGLRNWESSMNRHLIPMKYLIAKKAIAKAVDEGMIEPLFRDRVKYYFLVKLPPVGRPLAYLDKFGPSKEEAKQWARYEMGDLGREEITGEAKYERSKQRIKQEIERIGNQMRRKKKLLEKVESELNDKDIVMDKPQVDQLEYRKQRYEQDIRDLESELQDLKSQWKEIREQQQ